MVQNQICRSVEPPGGIRDGNQNNEVHQGNTHINTYNLRLHNEDSYKICTGTTTSGKVFGEELKPLDDDMVRIASLNINNLGVRAYSNAKQDALKHWIYDNEIGIIGIQEVGIAFHMQKNMIIYMKECVIYVGRKFE